MTRNLYRFYLYAVSIGLLIFAAVAIGRLLNIVLELTPLRASYATQPGSAEIVQSLVFATVSILIAGTLGGLHYWLIRRDMLHDPAAINSGIRAFFLNLAEAIGIVLAVPIVGFLILAPLEYSSDANVISGLAIALPILGVVLLLALEHRRNRIAAHSESVSTFQRICVFGTQILLLIFLTFALLSTFRLFIAALLFGSHGILQNCLIGYCAQYNLVYQAAVMLWFGICWVSYGLLTTRDRSARLRLIVHGISFAYGVVWILIGVYQLLQFGLSPLFNLVISLQDVFNAGARYDFSGQLVLGLLVAYVCHLWLRKIAQQGLIIKSVVSLTEVAIVASLAAGAFWWGCGFVLYNALQLLMPIPSAPDSHSWISSIALIIIGLAYIPLDLNLHKRNTIDNNAAGPLRGMVLTLLGGGIFALAIGGATALYTWVTALFGSPINNWQQIAHTGLAAFLIGIVLVGLYLSRFRREHLATSPTKQPEIPLTPVPATPVLPTEGTIEATLDALLLGSITRDEAASRIRVLSTTPMDSVS
jgi:hypothetical protein